jgi:hypothetical protein
MPKIIQNYTNERNELLQKMFNILEISKEHNMISLKKLDDDNDIQQKILDLIPDIKKYFICSKWNIFINKNREFKRTYLSLIKAVMKDMQIEITTGNMTKKTADNTNKCETFYYFKF